MKTPHGVHMDFAKFMDSMKTCDKVSCGLLWTPSEVHGLSVDSLRNPWTPPTYYLNNFKKDGHAKTRTLDFLLPNTTTHLPTIPTGHTISGHCMLYIAPQLTHGKQLPQPQPATLLSPPPQPTATTTNDEHHHHP